MNVIEGNVATNVPVGADFNSVQTSVAGGIVDTVFSNNFISSNGSPSAAEIVKHDNDTAAYKEFNDAWQLFA